MRFVYEKYSGSKQLITHKGARTPTTGKKFLNLERLETPLAQLIFSETGIHYFLRDLAYRILEPPKR